MSAILPTKIAGQTTLAQPQCNVFGLGTVCASNPPPSSASTEHAEQLCRNLCVKEMLKCSGNQALTLLGSDTVKTVRDLVALCIRGHGGGTAGDGQCHILDVPGYKRQHDLQHLGSGEDCSSPYVQELFDCMDDPALKQSRASIARYQVHCRTGSAGDGQCSFADLTKYASQRKSGQQMTCESQMLKELFDCIDDPELKEQRADLVKFQTMCHAAKPSCMPRIQHMNVLFSKGGTCCPVGSACRPSDGPPSSCSESCAREWCICPAVCVAHTYMWRA